MRYLLIWLTLATFNLVGCAGTHRDTAVDLARTLAAGETPCLLLSSVAGYELPEELDRVVCLELVPERPE